MKNEKGQFIGFSSPRYTQVPDELFDELLSELTGAELKVLMYVVRRTFGFKRDSDHISLSQMVNGIVKKDGVVLDKGTGLAKDSVARATKSLVEKGILVRKLVKL